MHRGREEIHPPSTSVVPDEMEGTGAGDNSLVVTDPPGAMLLPGGRRAVRVEGCRGYSQRLSKSCGEAMLMEETAKTVAPVDGAGTWFKPHA